VSSRFVAVKSDDVTEIHLPPVNGNYATLCGLDGNDAEVGQFPVPVPVGAKVTCQECHALWLLVSTYKPSDFARTRVRPARLRQSLSGNEREAMSEHRHVFWGRKADGKVGDGKCACGAIACRTCLGHQRVGIEMGCFGPKRFGRCPDCTDGSADSVDPPLLRGRTRTKAE
jgi:hypothetical protein